MCPTPDKPEFAFIGRSNVGKSSLINMLSGKKNLAKVSSAPGKTKLINHFIVEGRDEGAKNINSWYLVDLPGYGFAKVSQAERKKWESMIENYLRKRENLVKVFVLIDSRHKPQQIDLSFINKLGEWNVPFSLIFTKSDKETQRVVSKNIRDFLEEMRKEWEFLPSHFVTSTVKKMGRKELLNEIESLNKQLNQ